LTCRRLRPHLVTTLFPYTTLFRSRERGKDPPPLRDEPDAALRDLVAGQPGDVPSCEQDPPAAGAREPDNRADERRLAHAGGDITDRKSTRLNSSHGSISYAVFCLK